MTTETTAVRQREVWDINKAILTLETGLRVVSLKGDANWEFARCAFPGSAVEVLTEEVAPHRFVDRLRAPKRVENDVPATSFVQLHPDAGAECDEISEAEAFADAVSAAREWHARLRVTGGLKASTRKGDEDGARYYHVETIALR